MTYEPGPWFKMKAHESRKNDERDVVRGKHAMMRHMFTEAEVIAREDRLVAELFRVSGQYGSCCCPVCRDEARERIAERDEINRRADAYGWRDAPYLNELIQDFPDFDRSG